VGIYLSLPTTVFNFSSPLGSHHLQNLSLVRHKKIGEIPVSNLSSTCGTKNLKKSLIANGVWRVLEMAPLLSVATLAFSHIPFLPIILYGVGGSGSIRATL